MARLPLLDGRDNDPCPKANGTSIGADLKFTLLCNSDVVGDVLSTPDASDLNGCVNQCASSHPKCEAVSFSKGKCQLRANLRADGGGTRPSRSADAAVGQFPDASSNCGRLGGSQTVQPHTTAFATFCNAIINGKDIRQDFAPTFQDCMGKCAGTANCTAVSYDPSLNEGFKNCYLKHASAADKDPDPTFDTAVVQSVGGGGGGGGGDPGPAPAPSPATTTVLQPTTVVPDPVTVSAGGGGGGGDPGTASGASIFTPPAPAPPPLSSATAAPAPPPPPVSVETETVVSTLTSVSVSNALSVTQLITVPVTTVITSTGTVPSPPGTAPQPSGSADGSSSSSDSPAAQLNNSPPAFPAPSASRAWIAAPVVGSVAALVVVALVFAVLGRRRRRRGPGRPGSARTDESGESGAGLFAAAAAPWLPGSPRFRSRLAGAGAGAGMGNFSSVTGRGGVGVARAGSARSSVVGLLRPAGGGARPVSGADRLEDVEEGDDAFGRAEKKAAAGADGDGEKEAGTPVFEVRKGKMELRDSMNGLASNRWNTGERDITDYVYW